MNTSGLNSNSDSQLGSLLETVERLRAEHFGELDSALVRAVLRAHAEGKTPDADTMRVVEQAAERYLGEQP
jgi:hypothetical protein